MYLRAIYKTKIAILFCTMFCVAKSDSFEITILKNCENQQDDLVGCHDDLRDSCQMESRDSSLFGEMTKASGLTQMLENISDQPSCENGVKNSEINLQDACTANSVNLVTLKLSLLEERSQGFESIESNDTHTNQKNVDRAFQKHEYFITVDYQSRNFLQDSLLSNMQIYENARNMSALNVIYFLQYVEYKNDYSEAKISDYDSVQKTGIISISALQNYNEQDAKYCVSDSRAIPTRKTQYNRKVNFDIHTKPSLKIDEKNIVEKTPVLNIAKQGKADISRIWRFIFLLPYLAIVLMFCKKRREIVHRRTSASTLF